METLLVPGNGTGIPLDRLLGHPLAQHLLIQAALPAFGRVFWSTNPSGLIVAGCTSIVSLLCSLREHRRAVFLRAEGGEEVRCGGTYERGARYSAVIEPPHLREGYNEHVMELGGGAVFAAESLHDVGCDGTRAFGSFLRGKGDTWDTAPAPVAVMPTAGGNVSLVAGYACVFGDGIWLTETCEFAPGR